MKKLVKNPLSWGAVLFLGGMIIGGIGWDKHDSTLAARTLGSGAMMWLGGAMTLTGLAIFFTAGKIKTK